MLALIRPFLVYIISVVAALAAVSGVYWYIRHQGVVAEREKAYRAQVEAYQAQVAKADAVATKLEAQLAALKEANDQLKKDLQGELARNPVYRSCRVPADGVRILQRALRAAAR